jgi:hypothetical protein
MKSNEEQIARLVKKLYRITGELERMFPGRPFPLVDILSAASAKWWLHAIMGWICWNRAENATMHAKAACSYKSRQRKVAGWVCPASPDT